MKIIWFTKYMGMAVAEKLAKEGNEVTVAQIQDYCEIKGTKDKETPDMQKRRLADFDGMLKKLPADFVLKAMEKIEDKDDYFVFFDLNDMHTYSEKVLKMGFKRGFFPTKEDCEYEEDRNKAKDFVKKYYPGIEVGEVQEFSKIDEAITFLGENPDFVPVLKGNADACQTVVPSTDNPEFAQKIIEDALKSGQKDYESAGFILEKKIPNCIELTPEIMFWNGEPVFTTIDIENKPIGSGNIGKQVGCAQNLIIATELDDRINKIAFPPIIYEMAKKHPGMFIWDIGLLYQPDEDVFYFTEFCSMRVGYDAFFTELAMCANVTDFFRAVEACENPFLHKYGAAVRGFNHHPDKDIPNAPRGDMRMIFDPECEKDIWFFDVRSEPSDGSDEDQKPIYKNNGLLIDTAVFTGSGDNIGEAVDNAYETVANFYLDDMVYRPKFDFLSKAYISSIINRFDEFDGELYNKG